MGNRRIRGVLVGIVLALSILGGRVLMRLLDPTPYRSLMKAIYSGDVKAVRAELDRGTDPDDLPFAVDEPIGPLCAAAANGKVEIVKLLLDRGAKVNCGDGWSYSPLQAAAEQNQVAVMELLFARGASVIDCANGDSYALWSAAERGKVEAVKCLLAHGANPNFQADGSETLLSAVEERHQKAVARELRKAGAK